MAPSEQNWCDYTDPVTGYPVLSERGGMLYSDVDGCEYLLKSYTVDYSLSECRLISHPIWKTQVYPATFFTTCPPSILSDFFKQYKTIDKS